jgi:hypothetical protein
MSVSGLRDEHWCRADVECLDVFSIDLLRDVSSVSHSRDVRVFRLCIGS